MAADISGGVRERALILVGWDGRERRRETVLSLCDSTRRLAPIEAAMVLTKMEEGHEKQEDFMLFSSSENSVDNCLVLRRVLVSKMRTLNPLSFLLLLKKIAKFKRGNGQKAREGHEKVRYLLSESCYFRDPRRREGERRRDKRRRKA
jgi:hypothetical protein